MKHRALPGHWPVQRWNLPDGWVIRAAAVTFDLPPAPDRLSSRTANPSRWRASRSSRGIAGGSIISKYAPERRDLFPVLITRPDGLIVRFVFTDCCKANRS
jgi:hypothetical protein